MAATFGGAKIEPAKFMLRPPVDPDAPTAAPAGPPNVDAMVAALRKRFPPPPPPPSTTKEKL